MKNTIIYSIAVLLAVLSAACTETTEIGPEGPGAKPYVELSSDKVVFDADGGSAAIIVATNAAGWEYVSEGEWFTVTRQNDNTLVAEAAINAGAVPLTGKITVTAGSGEQAPSREVALVQRAERGVDLSAGGTANCYVAHTNGVYKIDARIKGNGGSDGRSNYIAAHGLEIEGAAYAELLWESRHDGDKTMSREIIDGTPIYKGGYIAFSTGRSEGNALIAVADIQGNILWSWHIWVTDNEITVHDHINPEGEVTAQIMDRNLGALNNIPMDLANRGMHYQWGRKDPFTPVRSPYYAGTESRDLPEYNETNYSLGNGSGVWEFQGTALNISTPPGNIPYAVAHPMRFLMPYNSQGAAHWYSTGTDDASSRSQLWSETKTIFDPCPPGYRVPGKRLWGIPSGNTSVSYGGGREEYDETGINERYEWNVEKDCGRVWRRTGDYYPLVGNVYYTSINGTTHNYSGGLGQYWTCEQTPETGKAYAFAIRMNGYYANYSTQAEQYTSQIRCVKE